VSSHSRNCVFSPPLQNRIERKKTKASQKKNWYLGEKNQATSSNIGGLVGEQFVVLDLVAQRGALAVVQVPTQDDVPPGNLLHRTLLPNSIPHESCVELSAPYILVLVEELDIDEVSNICCFKKKNLFG
jgi:hypothetical protein